MNTETNLGKIDGLDEYIEKQLAEKDRKLNKLSKKDLMIMSEVFEFEYNVLQEMLIVNHQEGFSYNMCYEDDVYSVTSKLNEQQLLISKLDEQNTGYMVENLTLKKENNRLKEENEKLRELIKGNVFGRYGEGSLADLEFKAIAYDDIVKLEMSYESEPKVIVICKQGKKENVKSFCQMFIPLGVAYEIKEVIDDE